MLQSCFLLETVLSHAEFGYHNVQIWGKKIQVQVSQMAGHKLPLAVL